MEHGMSSINPIAFTHTDLFTLMVVFPLTHSFLCFQTHWPTSLHLPTAFHRQSPHPSICTSLRPHTIDTLSFPPPFTPPQRLGSIGPSTAQGNKEVAHTSFFSTFLCSHLPRNDTDGACHVRTREQCGSTWWVSFVLCSLLEVCVFSFAAPHQSLHSPAVHISVN